MTAPAPMYWLPGPVPQKHRDGRWVDCLLCGHAGYPTLDLVRVGRRINGNEYVSEVCDDRALCIDRVEWKLRVAEHLAGLPR